MIQRRKDCVKLQQISLSYIYRALGSLTTHGNIKLLVNNFEICCLQVALTIQLAGLINLLSHSASQPQNSSKHIVWKQAFQPSKSVPINHPFYIYATLIPFLFSPYSHQLPTVSTTHLHTRRNEPNNLLIFGCGRNLQKQVQACPHIHSEYQRTPRRQYQRSGPTPVQCCEAIVPDTPQFLK